MKHLDLVDPLSVRSAHGGYKFVQSGIKVSSMMSFDILLKKKSDALEVSKVIVKAL